MTYYVNLKRRSDGPVFLDANERDLIIRALDREITATDSFNEAAWIQSVKRKLGGSSSVSTSTQ